MKTNCLPCQFIFSKKKDVGRNLTTPKRTHRRPDGTYLETDRRRGGLQPQTVGKMGHLGDADATAARPTLPPSSHFLSPPTTHTPSLCLMCFCFPNISLFLFFNPSFSFFFAFLLSEPSGFSFLFCFSHDWLRGRGRTVRVVDKEGEGFREKPGEQKKINK